MRYATMSSTKSSLRAGLLAFALVLLAGAVPQAAQAQARWLQNVQIIAPVEGNEATGALLDTLAAALDRGEPLPLYRTPEKEGRVSYSELSDNLLNEGLDLTSANRVFITYRFEADRQGFTETIEDLFFIYRPQAMEGTDIPVFYVDASDPAVKEMFRESGMTLRINEASFNPFREQLQFSSLIGQYANTTPQMIVLVGDQVIRDQDMARSEMRRLLATLRRFSY